MDENNANNTKFEPVVPANKTIAEVTVKALILGSLISVLFGVANAYLGLKFGMTVSASIPAAVISMAVLRKVRAHDDNMREIWRQAAQWSPQKSTSTGSSLCMTSPSKDASVTS